MTIVYFIRHAQADNTVREARTRPLTAKGFADRRLVTEFLRDKHVGAVYSSPYRRAVDTVSNFADNVGLPIQTVEDFRERTSDCDMRKDNELFTSFMERQWADFSYTLSDGESLGTVQRRNIAALNEILSSYKDENIVIGTHGTALSTIINYYDSSYGFKDFMEMVDIQPWVVKAYFDGTDCAGMEKTDLFRPEQKPDYTRCAVTTPETGALRAYRYVVTFARYQDKWLYCRAKDRDTYETPGGHIEPGETPLQAAKREFYEEAGSAEYDIAPVFDYSVHLPNEWSNGQVFLARIRALGSMPGCDMAEVKLFDTIPEKMRFPQILPVLYEKIKGLL